MFAIVGHCTRSDEARLAPHGRKPCLYPLRGLIQASMYNVRIVLQLHISMFVFQSAPISLHLSSKRPDLRTILPQKTSPPDQHCRPVQPQLPGRPMIRENRTGRSYFFSAKKLQLPYIENKDLWQKNHLFFRRISRLLKTILTKGKPKKRNARYNLANLLYQQRHPSVRIDSTTLIVDKDIRARSSRSIVRWLFRFPRLDLITTILNLITVIRPSSKVLSDGRFSLGAIKIMSALYSRTMPVSNFIFLLTQLCSTHT